MAVYFITGKLGSGKSLSAIARIRSYLLQHRPIATNIDLKLEKLVSIHDKTTNVTRLPDKPCAADLAALGYGNETYDEEKNGLLVLDECATWFNSRSWADKSRQPVIDWFLHARKKGWDIIFIVQDLSVIDKQARETLCEHSVYCRRLDRFRIPFVSAFCKTFFGLDVRMPRFHVAVVKYGDTPLHPTTDRWWYRGSDLYQAYDTKQIFVDDGKGSSCMLTPWHLAGRYSLRPPWTLRRALLASLFYPSAFLAIAFISVLRPLRGRWTDPPIYQHPDKLARPFLPRLPAKPTGGA